MTSVPDTKPPQGFKMWMSPYGFAPGTETPYDYELVEIWRSGNRDVVYPAKLHPAFNVANLYWRPAKRFGEEMSA
jgi:hypothetical protein